MIELTRNILWHRATTLLQNDPRKVRGMRLDQAKTVVVYGLYESADQFRTFNAFASSLAQQGLKVYRFVYYPPDALSPATMAFRFKIFGLKPMSVPSMPIKTDVEKGLFVISPLDIAFNRCPKPLFRQQLASKTEKTFDLFFDTSERFHYVDAYMTSLLPASFKIGFSKEIPLEKLPYDLMLKPGEGQDLRERLDLLLCYLNNF